MFVVHALLGILTGSLIHWAADVLPRFAVDRSLVPPNLRPHFAIGLLRPTAADRLLLAVETLTALLFMFLGTRAASFGEWVWLAAACAFFMLVAVIDLKYRLVLNVVIYPAAAVIVVAQLFVAHANVISLILGGAFGLIIFLAAAWLRPGDLGGGDVKLATLIGVLFGFPHVLWALLIGVVTGGGVAIALMVVKRWQAKAQMPYAPCLCLGAVVALLYNPLAAIFRF